MSNDECYQLKSINYKSMLLKENQNKKTINSIIKQIDNIDILLDSECSNSKKESWNKLDKTIKMEKINIYIDSILTSKHSLSDNEKIVLKKYMSELLDKKNLIKNKDVFYQKDSGKLESIPNLYFNSNTRKFSLKKTSQHVSTSKSLGPTKKNSTVRISKKTVNTPANTSIANNVN
tara:strand:+ start:334 stop:861 length:528 start_codon:yes stop_codon:yes gene_type:complete